MCKLLVNLIIVFVEKLLACNNVMFVHGTKREFIHMNWQLLLSYTTKDES